MADQTQGNESPQDSQGTAAPKATITLDDVNKAITARFASYEKKLDSKLTESFGGFETKLSELFAAKFDEAKQQPKDEPQQAGKAQAIEESPQFRSLQKQLTELKNQNERQRQEAEAERAKSRDLALRKTLSDELAASGLDPTRIKHAVGFLVDAEKRVRHDDSGQIVFAEGNGEALDLNTGLKSWLSSDDAKIYLPPRGSSGSGEKPNASNRGNGAPPDAAAEAQKAILAHFGLTG
jgi:hypothetical protein